MNCKSKNLLVTPDQVSNSSIPIVNNESVTHDNPRKNKYNSYTCFISENLDLEELVRTNPPAIPKFHVDKLVYMAGLLIEIPLRKKDVIMDYVPINSALVQRRVRDYRRYLDYLIDCRVIEENRQYINGSQSRGFRYAKEYITAARVCTLNENRALLKSLSQFKEINYSFHSSNFESATLKSSFEDNKRDLTHVSKWLNNKLTIDYEPALEFLTQLREKERLDPEIKNCDLRFQLRQAALLKFHKGIFLPNEDSTAGRLHSALTQIKSVLRPFIRYDGRRLIAVDIVNSQPYLAISLLNPFRYDTNNISNLIININPKNDFLQYPIMLVKTVETASIAHNTKLYVDLVTSGSFYEEFGLMLKKEGIIDEKLDDKETRDKAKNATFSALFNSNNAISFCKEMNIFKRTFPEVYAVFKMVKLGKGHHNTLAILLQSLEALLILHKACKIISEEKPNVPILTLHDSIITTEGNEEYVHAVMKNVLTEAIGVPPVLKIERWE